MVIVIDVGNTNTVLGLMEGREVVQTFRVSTTQRTTDETGVLFLTLLAHRGVDLKKIDFAKGHELERQPLDKVKAEDMEDVTP